jgi:hypothetical protein
MATPTLDGIATLATDNINTHGRATLALTNLDMFGGLSTTTYLETGNPLPAVMQSAAVLDDLAVTTGDVNGAVADSHLTITHTGRLHLAPGVVLLAVVCPEVAANLMHRHAAHAECGHRVFVRDTRTHRVILRINEDHGVLPLQLRLSGTGLLDLAERLEPSESQRSPWGSHTIFYAWSAISTSPTHPSS